MHIKGQMIELRKLEERWSGIEDALFELFGEIFDVDPVIIAENKYWSLDYSDELVLKKNGFMPDYLLEIWGILFEGERILSEEVE